MPQPTPRQTHMLVYGSDNNYYVRPKGRGLILFSSKNKSEAVSRAQILNGWPADGDEQSYSRQVEESKR